RQRSPLRKSFWPSRRHCLHWGEVSLATDFLEGSDAAPLARTAAVVGLWGDVLDTGHIEAGGLQRTDRRLAPGAGPLDEDLDLLQALLDALARRGVGCDLGGERGRLARALETGAAGGLPGDHVAPLVGQRHDRVVERRLDVRLADRNVLLDLAATAGWAFGRRHYFLPAFFLPATCIRRGPLRVRALVLVFWPRTGRPRRWRMPRGQPVSVRRLMSCERSRRRLPSIVISWSIASRSLPTFSSVRSRT